MAQLIDSTFEGLFFPITIDGEMIVQGLENSMIFPSGYNAVPQVLQEYVDTADSGSVLYQPIPGPGHADVSDRWTFSIPYASVNGLMKVQLEKIRVRGRIHDYTDWKPCFAAYTGTGERNTFYLPHFRRNAGQTMSGLNFRGMLTGTDAFPLKLNVGGDDLDVFYEDGPVLTDNGPGTVTVSKVPDTTRHVPFFVSDAPDSGAQMTLEFFPHYLVTMLNVTHSFPVVGQETHSYVFREK